MPRKSTRIQARKIKVERIIVPDVENVSQVPKSKKRKADDVEPLQNIQVGKSDGRKKQRIETPDNVATKNVTNDSLEVNKQSNLSPYCHRTEDPLYNKLPSCKLPKIRWVDENVLWKKMFEEPVSSKCHESLFNCIQKFIKPTMRTILIDWMMEVCSAYNLQRETFCLSIQFTDRYLSATENIQKQQLQLIGVTALFIAAKMEEIYPPRLSDFAEMTDGACSEDNIMEFEVILLDTLEWNLVSMTPNAWLGVFMQIINCDNSEENSTDLDDNFVLPQFHHDTFHSISVLLDLCYLDYKSSLFRPSVLAASAMHFEISPEVAIQVSGLSPTQLDDCINWLKPIYEIKNKNKLGELKNENLKKLDNFHNIQSHVISLDLNNEILNLRKAEKAKTPQLTSLKSDSSSPAFLTPPPSHSKSVVKPRRSVSSRKNK